MLATALDEIAAWQPDVIHLHSHGLKLPELQQLQSCVPRARLFETNVFAIPSPIEKDLTLSFQLSQWCLFLYHCRRGDRVKSIVIPNPVKSSTMFKPDADEVARFKVRHGIPAASFVIGRIGQAYTRKWSEALPVLFDRFVREVDANAHLLLCNPSEDIVAAIAQNPRIRPKATIIDSIIGDEQLRLFYGAMDVMLHIANVGESFGMVLGEALLCETPVLTLNTPWGDNAQSEVIGREVAGNAANDLDELYRYLVALHKDRQQCELQGRLGRQHVLQHFDMLKVAKQAVAAMNAPAAAQLDLRSVSRYTHDDWLARMLIRAMYTLQSVRVGNWAGRVFMWRAGLSKQNRKAIPGM
jgi:glycosyltransferase involved in cell wall biosynthesis